LRDNRLLRIRYDHAALPRMILLYPLAIYTLQSQNRGLDLRGRIATHSNLPRGQHEEDIVEHGDRRRARG
jgi:hypothetical protein